MNSSKNKTRTKSLFLAVAASLGYAAVSFPLHADTINWTNSSGGDFSNPANWNNGAGPVPGMGDVANFDLSFSNATTTFDIDPTNAGLTVSSFSGNTNFRADTFASRTYTITGDASISTGSLTLAGPASGSNTLHLNVAGNLSLTNSGGMSVNAGNTVSCNSLNNSSNGSLSINGGTFNANGATNFSSGSLTVSNGLFNSNGNFVGNSSIPINITGGTFNSYSTFDSNLLTISGGIFNANGSFSSNTLSISGGSINTFASFSANSLNITGGTINAFGGFSFPGLAGTVNIIRGSINTNANLDIGNRTVSLTQGATLSVATGSSTTLVPTSRLNITESTASLGTLIVNGGIINFVSGSLSYDGNLTVGAGGLLGTNLTLEASRALVLSGTTTISPQRILTLSGGSLSTGNLVNNGTFTFNSGTLSLTGPSGLTIGIGGSLGSTLTTSAGRTINVSALTTIASSGTLVVGDGAFNALGGVSNSGEIRLSGIAPVLSGGPITNAKLIRGDGRINNNLTNTATGEIRAEANKTLLISGENGINSGRINLQGGTIQYNQPLTNGTTGTISGTGFLYADSGLSNSGKIQIANASLFTNSGLTNDGEIQISSGLTSFYGPVTNNNKITVTGGGTATFYDALVMSPGSTFQTSINSTSVFFGPVTGIGIFTGPGLKNFEGGATSTITTIASITGSTSVGSGTTLQTNAFDESNVFIDGTLHLNPDQIPSRTSSLLIDPVGRLNTTNNDLLINYTSASPYETLTGYIASDQILPDANFEGYPTLLVLFEASDLGLSEFEGFEVDSTTVIGKFTYTGDANLDGRVDAFDYSVIDDNFGTPRSFITGDLNQDGFVDSFDYSAIDDTFGAGVNNPLSPSTSTEVFIPEPTSLSLIAFSGLLHPRRRSA